MVSLIINLKDSIERRAEMNHQISFLRDVNPEFIEAVDGRKMTELQRKEMFDIKSFKRLYSKNVRPGEIGCTLSHQKCYREIIKKKLPYALILEDDAIITDVERTHQVLSDLNELFSESHEPIVVLLSSWFWYLGNYSQINNTKFVKVYDGFSTYAYVVNNEAASCMIEERPFVTADDWFYWKKKGVRVLAVLPHVISHPTDESIPSTVSNVPNEKISFKAMFKYVFIHFRRLLLRKVLMIIGRYEKYAPVDSCYR